jgi:hypothetical protein
MGETAMRLEKLTERKAKGEKRGWLMLGRRAELQSALANG